MKGIPNQASAEDRSSPLEILYFVSWVLVVFLVGASSIVDNRASSNALFPTGESPTSYSTSSVFRQGWGFFTRDPKEPSLRVLQIHDGELNSIDHGNVNRFSAAFGLSRAHRAYAADTSAIYSAVMKDEQNLVDCRVTSAHELEKCVEGRSPIEVDLSPAFEDICGESYIAIRRPIPFAYSRITRESETKVARIEVHCAEIVSKGL